MVEASLPCSFHADWMNYLLNYAADDDYDDYDDFADDFHDF